MQVQFEQFPLRSLLLGESQLVSLPLHTWMLPFWRFPLHIGAPQVSSAAGSPIRVSPDRSLHAATRAIWQVATPCRGRSPLSHPLQPACGPRDLGHTDLPWPAPSSLLARAVPLVCPESRRNPVATRGTGLVRCLT